MKTILVDLDAEAAEDGRLGCATDLARAFASHVIGLQVTPLADLVGFDMFGGVFTLPAVLDAVAERETTIRASFEATMAQQGASWEFRHFEGPPAAVTGEQSRLADVVLVAKPGDGDGGRGRLAYVGELALSSSAPLLAIPSGQRSFDPFGKAIVAWNGSPEASAAVRAAMPMLKLASDVTILSAEDPDAKWDIPPTGLAEFLSRHDIHASTERIGASASNVPHTLLRYVADRQPGYLVMGAYGRSRASEWVLGGVTRRMLQELPVPVLIAH
jgi:nucleotide-binding universal stress UspA family protein